MPDPFLAAAFFKTIWGVYATHTQTPQTGSALALHARTRHIARQESASQRIMAPST
ncbi:hypothetical protein AmDm5_1165 [Acetobacter malorum]|nr:hypothetical protein AmDm5_1165 [Acetobacter malorum]